MGRGESSGVRVLPPKRVQPAAADNTGRRIRKTWLEVSLASFVPFVYASILSSHVVVCPSNAASIEFNPQQWKQIGMR
jgi:hypothetical protein